MRAKSKCKFHEMETCVGSSRNNEEVIVADIQWPVERTEGSKSWKIRGREWRQITESLAQNKCSKCGYYWYMPSLCCWYKLGLHSFLQHFQQVPFPKKKACGTDYGPITSPQCHQWSIWVLIDPGLSVSDNCFSSFQGPVHPNEDASLALASCMAGKEQCNQKSPSRWRSSVEHLPCMSVTSLPPAAVLAASHYSSSWVKGPPLLVFSWSFDRLSALSFPTASCHLS